MTHINNTRWLLNGLTAMGMITAFCPAQSFGADDQMEQLLKILKTRESITESEYKALSSASKSSSHKSSSKDSDKWYEKLKIDGYTQVRFTEQINDRADLLHVPADRSVNATEGLIIRRGRFKISGDVTPRLHMYSQLDFAASNGGSSFALQARDLYADIAIDDAKEHRIRAGLSKVPYGWVNMQSSQNRAAIERPEALNSGVEGERDQALYYMYASKESRALFKELVKDGHKGSGDYGVVTLGAFGGQGLNKSDLNGEPHVLARVSYPWKSDNGQIQEFGFGGYYGKYVTALSNISGGKAVSTLTTRENPGDVTDGFRDERYSAHYILYPQPFGIEAEWTWGRGPELNKKSGIVEDGELKGGYVQANYRIKGKNGAEYYPFARWNHFDGARKFATNAPGFKVNEFDLGIEWQPRKDYEVALVYTRTMQRTDTSKSPYTTSEDASRLAIQLQFNY